MRGAAAAGLVGGADGAVQRPNWDRINGQIDAFFVRCSGCTAQPPVAVLLYAVPRHRKSTVVYGRCARCGIRGADGLLRDSILDDFKDRAFRCALPRPRARRQAFARCSYYTLAIFASLIPRPRPQRRAPVKTGIHWVRRLGSALNASRQSKQGARVPALERSESLTSPIPVRRRPGRLCAARRAGVMQAASGTEQSALQRHLQAKSA